NEDGDIVLVTVNHDVVLAFPSLPSNQNLEAVLRAAGLVLDFDTRANMLIRDAGADSGTGDSALESGRQLQALRVDTYFSARPDVLALAAQRFNEEGLYRVADPALANRVLFTLVYRDASGALLEQDI